MLRPPPVADTWKLAVLPISTVTSAGWLVMTGMERIAKATVLEVTYPALFFGNKTIYHYRLRKQSENTWKMSHFQGYHVKFRRFHHLIPSPVADMINTLLLPNVQVRLLPQAPLFSMFATSGNEQQDQKLRPFLYEKPSLV